MDEPARKRRKTTPPEARERSHSPLKKPPRRPSFASPTKASLARNYPNLLPQQPTSSSSATSRPNSRGDILAQRKQAHAFISSETAGQRQISQGALEKEDERQATAGAQLPHAQNVTPRSRRVEGRRGSAVPLGDVDEDEADLPTTPSQRALEKDTPRRGILFSSPTKRPARLKDPTKQSPLRPKAHPVMETQTERLVGETVEHEQVEGTTKKQEQAPDPELEKRKREKARLQRELEELERLVEQCTEEIVKIQEQPANHVLQPSELDDLIAFISKISNVKMDEEQPPLVSSLLCSFLPFSTRAISPPKPKELWKPIASHKPLELDDPLPYLQMFTSFKFTTQLSLSGEKVPTSNSVYQKHTVDVVGPQKLLTASISIIINTLANEIIDLHFLQLSPWAERELGKFVRLKAKEKDLGNACWSIGSYWDIAKKRAEYWHKCETAFVNLIAGRTSDDTENFGQQEAGKPAQSISRKDLSRHLGRDILILEDRHVLLKISWRIDFDWTGEAESDISVEPAFPRVWSEADNTGSFKKIPETFDSLLRSRGAFEATRALVALLFPH